MFTNWIILILCGIVIASYLFDLIARKIRLPSVLLLLGTGIGIRMIADHFHLEIPYFQTLLEFFGVLGLILIVLEGALELPLSRNKLGLIARAFLAALLVCLSSAVTIGLLLGSILSLPFRQCFVNALPLAVISSAIAIPSVATLGKWKRQFVIYESTFSDILGILIFNYASQDLDWGFGTFLSLVGDIGAVSIISLVCSLVLVYIITRVRFHVKFFLILAVLVLVYTAGKMFHLSTLLLVLVFGLIINNTNTLTPNHWKSALSPRRLTRELRFLKVITSESAFLIRTFFFILFGFSMQLRALLNSEIWLLSGLIILILLAVRYLYLRHIARMTLLPELFIAPRGLVTILLYYSIPAHLLIPTISEAILFLVILSTTLLMVVGLLLWREEAEELQSSLTD